MADTITFRPDDDALRALAVLTKDGTTVSNALRSALIDAARLRSQEKLRSDSAALAANEQDRAEAAQVFRDMQTLRVVVTSTDYAVPKRANGREQNGSRFAVVVQSDSSALFIWLVAPTSTSAMAAGFRPEIDVLGRRTRLRRLAPRNWIPIPVRCCCAAG